MWRRTGSKWSPWFASTRASVRASVCVCWTSCARCLPDRSNRPVFGAHCRRHPDAAGRRVQREPGCVRQDPLRLFPARQDQAVSEEAWTLYVHDLGATGVLQGTSSRTVFWSMRASNVERIKEAMIAHKTHKSGSGKAKCQGPQLLPLSVATSSFFSLSSVCNKAAMLVTDWPGANRFLPPRRGMPRQFSSTTHAGQ